MFMPVNTAKQPEIQALTVEAREALSQARSKTEKVMNFVQQTI